MPEEKAALLVRKFFGNSIIESKKSRMAQTETIAEESSEPEVAPSLPLRPQASPRPWPTRDRKFQPDTRGSLPDVRPEVGPEVRPEVRPEVLVDSLDSEELFRLCGASDFGSSQDALDMDSVVDDVDDDDDDDGSVSFRTTTSTLQRYSSCSERSVRLSDIINRPDPPSLPISASASAPAVVDVISVSTSALTSKFPE